VRDAVGSGIEFAAQIPAGGLYPARLAATAENVATAGAILSPLSDLSKVEDMEALERSSLDFDRFTPRLKFVRKEGCGPPWH
jgi:phospholipid-binding lipoprotein MlaA